MDSGVTFLNQKYIYFSLQCLKRTIASLLICGKHFAHVDVVTWELLFGMVDGLCGENAWAWQDPGKVHMKEPENISAWINKHNAVVVSGQDPVWGVGSNCIYKKTADSELTKDLIVLEMCCLNTHRGWAHPWTYIWRNWLQAWLAPSGPDWLLCPLFFLFFLCCFIHTI